MTETKSDTMQPCLMTEVINEIKSEQVEQKITLVTLTSEVTRLVSAVSDLVETQKKSKDKSLDAYRDTLKSVILLLLGYGLSLL